MVDPSGARRWIVRVVVKGQKNKKGAPLRTDFGLGGADIVTLNQARERALEYRRMAKQGLNPRFNARQEITTFEEVAQQVHIDRMPTWKNAKHGQQWINTLRDYAFPKIGRMPVDSIDQPEVLMCLSPIWMEKYETAKTAGATHQNRSRCRQIQRLPIRRKPSDSDQGRAGSAEGRQEGEAPQGDGLASCTRLVCRSENAQRDGCEGADVHLPDRFTHGRGSGHEVG